MKEIRRKISSDIKSFGCIVGLSFTPWILFMFLRGYNSHSEMISYAICIFLTDLIAICILKHQMIYKRKAVYNIIKNKELDKIIDEVCAMNIEQITVLREKSYKYISRTKMSQMAKGLVAIVVAAIVGAVAGEVEWKELVVFGEENMVAIFSLLIPMIILVLGEMGYLERMSYTLETDYTDCNIQYVYELCSEIVKSEQEKNLNIWKEKQEQQEQNKE